MPNNQRLAESKDGKPWIWRPNCKVRLKLSTAWGLAPLTPRLFWRQPWLLSSRVVNWTLNPGLFDSQAHVLACDSKHTGMWWGKLERSNGSSRISGTQGVRTCRPKLCCFGILIELKAFEENSRCQNLTFFLPPKKQERKFLCERCPLCQEEETSLLTEVVSRLRESCTHRPY